MKIQSQFEIITALTFWSSSLKQFKPLDNTSELHVRTLIHHLCILFTSKTFGFSIFSINFLLLQSQHNFNSWIAFSVCVFVRLYMYEKILFNIVHRLHVVDDSVLLNCMCTTTQSLPVRYLAGMCMRVCYEEGKCLNWIQHIYMTPPTATFILYTIFLCRIEALVYLKHKQFVLDIIRVSRVLCGAPKTINNNSRRFLRLWCNYIFCFVCIFWRDKLNNFVIWLQSHIVKCFKIRSKKKNRNDIYWHCIVHCDDCNQLILCNIFNRIYWQLFFFF